MTWRWSQLTDFLMPPEMAWNFCAYKSVPGNKRLTQNHSIFARKNTWNALDYVISFFHPAIVMVTKSDLEMCEGEIFTISTRIAHQAKNAQMCTVAIVKQLCFKLIWRDVHHGFLGGNIYCTYVLHQYFTFFLPSTQYDLCLLQVGSITSIPPQ